MSPGKHAETGAPNQWTDGVSRRARGEPQGLRPGKKKKRRRGPTAAPKQRQATVSDDGLVGADSSWPLGGCCGGYAAGRRGCCGGRAPACCRLALLVRPLQPLTASSRASSGTSSAEGCDRCRCRCRCSLRKKKKKEEDADADAGKLETRDMLEMRPLVATTKYSTHGICGDDVTALMYKDGLDASTNAQPKHLQGLAEEQAVGRQSGLQQRQPSPSPSAAL